MSREQSAIIKGIAIILMLIYHLGNIPGIQGLDNLLYSTLSASSHPVNFFLIVSGYGLYYVFSQGRISWHYLFKRTMKLYIAFWFVLLVFVVGLATWLYPGRFDISWSALIVNFIGWRWGYCIFTWFLMPYILVSITAKRVFHVIERLGNVTSLIVGMVVYLFSCFLISRYFVPWLQWHFEVYHVILWAQSLFGLTVGVVMARMCMAGKGIIWKRLDGKNLLVTFLLVALFVIRGQIHSAALNPIHASLVVWLVLHLRWSGLLKKVFIELGDKSMIMWFSQGFLGVVMFSEYILRLQSPLLIWIVWAVVCYLVACLIKPVVNMITRAVKLT